MINYLILLLGIFITPLLAQNGKAIPDTIFCDAKNTSYLIFSEEVSLCDIGYADDYAAQVKGNMVFIKALNEGIQPTTFLIKTGDNIYFGMLKYKTGNQKYYYDFKANKVNSANAENDNSPKPAQPATDIKSQTIKSNNPLKEKTEEFLKIKNELSTLGFISPTLDAAVTVIRNDNNNTFLKVIFRNKSSIPYKLDFISFQYFQDMKKGALRKSKKAPIDVFPVSQPSIKEIAPGKTEVLAYVIPSFALSNNGYLMILVRESSGDRVMKIKIEGSIIQNSPQMANGK